MQSALDARAADDVSTLLKALVDEPMSAPRDVERLRLAFYREAAIDRRRVAEIIQTNRKMRVHNDCWTEFYLEALTDFFLECQNDILVLPAESERTLLSWLADGAAVNDPRERRLILRVFLKAARVSERFERWVLRVIEDNLLHHAVRWNDGTERRAGEIDMLDLQLIRRLIGGAGGCFRETEGVPAIDFLLNLDRNAVRFTDPARWRSLLAESLARQVFVGSLSGCEGGKEKDAERLNALSKLLEGGYSPTKAASLREDVILARTLMTSIGHGHQATMFLELTRL